MINPAITTAVKMLEALPETAQNQVIEHMREYIATLRDEQQWDAQFQYTQPRLSKAAQQARQQIAEGKAQPLDIEQL